MPTFAYLRSLYQKNALLAMPAGAAEALLLPAWCLFSSVQDFRNVGKLLSAKDESSSEV